MPGRNFMGKAFKMKKIGLVLLITALDLLFGPFLLVVLGRMGYPTYSVTEFEQYPGKVLLQTALLSTYFLILFLIFRSVLKEKFSKAMGLRAETSLQIQWLALMGILLVIAAAVGIRRTEKPIQILYGLFYFVFAVGFTEEFLIRGVCVYLLKDFSWQVKYLLPSFLFAMLHIFAYAGFAPLTLDLFKEFAVNQLWTLMASGCCLQLLKDRTGTLWVPILVHGLMDFCITFL